MTMQISKIESEFSELQKDVNNIQKILVALQKDIEHMSMKLDSYVVASSSEIKDLQQRVYKLESKIIWMSGFSAAIGAVVSFLSRYVSF